MRPSTTGRSGAAGASAAARARRLRRRSAARRIAGVVAGAALWAGFLPIEGAAVRPVLVALAVCVVVWPASAGRWAAGAAGERATARALEGVGREGWAVLHDVRMGDRRWNLDHVLIGPGGVVVVDSKQWRQPVRTVRRHPRVVKRHVGWQVDAVGRVLDPDGSLPVHPFLCVHGARVRRLRRAAAVGDGVHLRRWLRRLPPVLAGDEVEAVVRRARRVFG